MRIVSSHLNASAFLYDYKDKQLLTKAPIPVFGAAFTLDNVDDATVKGVELDLQWLPADGLTIFAGLGWLDTEIDNGQGFNQKSEFIDLQGSPLPFAAEWQANISTKYEWAVTGSLVAMVGVDVSYSDESHHDFESGASETLFLANDFGADFPSVPYTFDQNFMDDSYTLLDARVGLLSEDHHWKAYLWVRNLTDENYATVIVKNVETTARYAGMTRNYGIIFEYYWD